MTKQTPENPLIDFIDHAGVNRIKTSDMHRALEALEMLGEGASEEVIHEADRSVNYFAHTASDFVCSTVLQAPDAQKEEVAEIAWGQVVQATDIVVLGADHPSVSPEHPDINFSVEEIVPAEAVKVDPQEKATWRSRVQELVSSMVEGEVRLFIAY